MGRAALNFHGHVEKLQQYVCNLEDSVRKNNPDSAYTNALLIEHRIKKVISDLVDILYEREEN